METLPKFQRSPGSMNESSSSNNNQNKPETHKFYPDKDIRAIFNELNNQGYFDEFEIEKNNTGSIQSYQCRVVVKKLPNTIKENKENKEKIVITFWLVNKMINTKPQHLIFFNSSSNKEEIKKKIIKMIDKKISKKDKNKNETRKGLDSERVVFGILNILEKEKIICQFSKADFEDDTKRKRDFMIEYKSFVIPLQIKSSEMGQSRHKEDDYGVPSLVVHQGDTDNKIKEKIIKILDSYVTSGSILHL